MSVCTVVRAVGCLLLLAAVAGTEEERTLTREQQLSKLQLEERFMQLEQRKASMETQRQELETTKDLFERQFVALQTYRETENSYKDAVLRYEQAEIMLEETKLDLLKNATRIVVRGARKYKTEDGRAIVDIVLENSAETRDALLVDPSLTEDELHTLLKVENIYVSLKYGPVVGEPYEIHIPSLDVSERRTLTYRLLRDEEAVEVALTYLDLEESQVVILRKGGQQELPSINSAQFSQTRELQETARFDLTLERLSDEERSFALAVVGLPRIDYAFVDNGARVNQVKFDENKSKVVLALELEIPEKLDRRFVGRTRTFFALVTEPSEYGSINDLKARYGNDPVPEEEVKLLKSNYVKLELFPKGIGKLEVLVSNRYKEINVGEDLEIRVEFLNPGTVAVQNIKAALDVAYEWQAEAEPPLIKVLEPNERQMLLVKAQPPDDLAVGNYELGIEAQGQVGNENVESLEKNITIHVGARSNIAGNTILIGILVLLVFGIGLASIKISRR